MSQTSRLLSWYHNTFKDTSLFRDMEAMTEGSPYHRERNVGIHTDMVVAQYLLAAEKCDTYDLGLLVCIFHDVGKPSSVVHKHNEERGYYKSFPGHEWKSARMWEDYVTTNWDTFVRMGLTVTDIYRVGCGDKYTVIPSLKCSWPGNENRHLKAHHA